MLCVGLGAPLGAQEPRDSVKADTTARPRAPRDSVVKDTVKSPIAVAPRAVMPEIRRRRVVWDREAIFSSGAVTLPDLLAQVPGVTGLHAGFIASVSATSWYGEPGRVRVYLDGIELDALDPREGGIRDLGVIQIWSLEEVAVERAAGELRVHLRSWRVRLTTAETRTDIVTGSENTNLYRGFFGKRMQSGGVLQLAAQQYSTTSVRSRGDGDGLAAFARIGVARGRLTIDAVANRYGRTRNPTIRNLIFGTPDLEAIPAFKGRELAAYLRAAWGDPDADGLWLQAIAATTSHVETAEDPPGGAADVDTARSQSQYVGAVGFTKWGARISATGRLRSQHGEQRIAPALRASWDNRWVSIAGFAEVGGPDSTDRQDASVLITPLSWLHAGASHSIHTPEDELARGPARTTSRAEAGVRLWGRWVTGGVVRRSISRVSGPIAFDTAFGSVALAEARGVEASISGKLFGPLSFEWRGIQWDADELYRPRTESFAELRVATALARYLKRGNFMLTASVQHEYRDALETPAAGGGTQRTLGVGTYSSMLDIRIGTAHIFWYNRNLTGKVYESVPGYLMPRMVQLYGVRWEFWN